MIMNAIYPSFNMIDSHFARVLNRMAKGGGSPAIYAAAALVSKALQDGSICINLKDMAGLRVINQPAALDIVLPDVRRWRELLLDSSLVGMPGDYRPLILDDSHRLYLHKYFKYETSLIENIRRRLPRSAREGAAGYLKDVPTERVKDLLRSVYPDAADGSHALPIVATLLCAVNRLTVISGGPGTGKTTAVIRIISFLRQLASDRLSGLLLAAPTGKAAARLQEAVSSKSLLSPGSNLDMDNRASTVHRLMGRGRLEGSLVAAGNDPLDCDLLILDEASMLDISLTAKLFCALPDSASLLLLGDRNQLGSIEAGSVFADLHGDTEDVFNYEVYELLKHYLEEGDLKRIKTRSGPAIQDTMIELKDNYRFAPASPIGRLSRAVVAGAASAAVDLLKSHPTDGLRWEELPPPKKISPLLESYFLPRIRAYFAAVKKGAQPEEVFNLFSDFAILCALRQGQYGSLAFNHLIEIILRNERICAGRGQFYPGRPIMIAKNNYDLGLFNGDVGIMLPDPENREDQLSVFFPAYDHPEGMRRIPLNILPENETIYAMTIHKAQGSEYNNVLIVLPDTDSPILTRELIYTAITRGRQTVAIWGKEDVLKRAIERRISRFSGLREALWKL